MSLSLKELKERRERGLIATESPRQSDIRVDVLLSADGEVESPVALAKALMEFGLTLAKAHDVLNRLVERESVSVTLHLTPGGQVPFALTRFGVSISQRIDEALPLTVSELLPPNMEAKFKDWRRAISDHISERDALRLMVEKYLAEHGITAERNARQGSGLYEPE